MRALTLGTVNVRGTHGPVQALDMLPSDLKVSELYNFFEAVLGDDTRERHTNQVKKNLLKSEHLQVQEQLIHYRSRRATIASDRMCPVCNKRIGTRYARSRRRACALRAPT